MKSGALAFGAALLAASTSASAQSQAVASLHPVEGGRWAVTVDSAPVEERICLRGGLYVVATRVEPGYGGGFAVRQFDTESWPTSVLKVPEDGERWGWASFVAGTDPRSPMGRPCFVVSIAATGALTNRQLRALAVRVQLYEVRIGVEW